MSDINVGTLLAYLRLDRSDYSDELKAAGVEADKLAEHSPNIKVNVNSATALTQLTAVAAAVRRLQDAQGQERVAEQRLQELRTKGNASTSQIAKAEEAVTRARRSQASATIQLAAAYAQADEANKKVAQSSQKAEKDLKLLSTAALALGPAIVPIGAAAIAAGASVVALGATGLLAFEGIKKEMADGTTTGKAYTAGVNTLKGDLDTLERTAAKGVLSGFQASVKDLQPLMPTLNSDTAALSSKLGDIVSHVMPGMVRLFTDANPLLLDFADDLDKGAAKFDAWTQSSDGARKFVAYAQAQLPKVEQTVVSLATSAGHLAQGLAPLGGSSLAALTAFSRVVNALPIGVLQALAPAIVGLKVASTVSAGVTNLAVAFEKFGGTARLLSYGDLALATGQIGAMAAAVVGLNTVLEKFGNGSSSGTQAIANFSRTGTTGANGLSKALHSVATVLGLSHDKTKENTDAVNALNTAAGQLGGAPTTAVNALLGAQTQAGIVIDGVTYSINKQTTASGLLKTALDALNGTSLSVETTQNQFLDTEDQLRASVKQNGASIDQNSTKGRANREVLVSLISAASAHAQAVADSTTKTKGLSAGTAAGSAAFKAQEGQIKDVAHALGLNDAQVAALIASIGKVPKSVAPKINVHMTGAQQVSTLKANIAALKSKQIDITTYVQNVIVPTLDRSGQAHGTSTGEHSGPGHASGGLIRGPGSGTSDSIPTRLSDGEYVIKAAAVNKYGKGFFDRVNALAGPAHQVIYAPQSQARPSGQGVATSTPQSLRLVGPVTLTVDGVAMSGFVDGRVEQHADDMADSLIYGRQS